MSRALYTVGLDAVETLFMQKSTHMSANGPLMSITATRMCGKNTFNDHMSANVLWHDPHGSEQSSVMDVTDAAV